MTEYKANSDRVREVKEVQNEPITEKNIKQVTKGVVKTKKKNSFVSTFIQEDIGSVKDYVITDVIVPTVKKLIYDTFTNTLGMMLGENVVGRRKGTSEKVSYRKYYDDDRDRYDRKDYNKPTARSARYSYDEIILDNRGEAEAVIARMKEIIRQYDIVSVLDLYDLVGIKSEHTDNKYGWTDLRTADCIRLRDGGYQLKLPKALPLD